LHAGTWYWWSCFPKDVQALIETWKDFDFDFKIIKSTEEINEKQKIKTVDKLLKLIKNSPIIPFNKGDENTLLKWKNIAIWWLAFKPKTDDIRDAPSIDVINKLLELWVDSIQAFDPIAMSNMEKLYNSEKKITFTSTNYDAVKRTDALIILTEWDEFRNSDFEKIKLNMNWSIIIDWRNIWNKKEVEKFGFIYEWIGK